MDAVEPLTQAEFSDLISPLNLAHGEDIAVAISGGADSLALTLMLGDYCRVNGISMTAITVDHGLRAEAAEEAKNVGQWLEKYHIPHVVLKWQGDKPTNNIQNEARLARYGLMGEWCQKNNVAKLFLAHHQGDQAETFLIRLFRGSGVDGLAAMKMQSDFPVYLPGMGNITLCRPLLGIAKERLEVTLQNINQPWIEDPSNQNDAYTRIKVRNLLKHNDIEGLNTARLAQTAARMGRVQSLLLSLTEEVLQQAVTYFPQGYAEVDLSHLFIAHEEIALRCLALICRRVSGGKYAPRLARLEGLYGRLKEHNFSGQTLGGCLISPLKNRRIIISREVSTIESAINIKFGQTLLWDGRFFIENTTTDGILKRIESCDWQTLYQEHPDLKKFKLHNTVKNSLPCIVTKEDKVILPDFIQGFEKTGFRAAFKE